jgi:hypothetical protein
VFRQRFLSVFALLSAVPQAVDAMPRDAEPAAASPSSVLPAPMEPEPIPVDAARIAKAQEWLERIADGRIDRTQLDPQLSALLTDDFVRGGTDDVRAYGRPAQLIPFDIRTNAEGVATFYRVRYPAETLTWILRTSSGGQINGWSLRRSAQSAIYRVAVRDTMGTF